MVYRAADKAASREFKAREAGYRLARQIERAAKRGVHLYRAFFAYARVAPQGRRNMHFATSVAGGTSALNSHIAHHNFFERVHNGMCFL
jgi:hypothetical protein